MSTSEILLSTDPVPRKRIAVGGLSLKLTITILEVELEWIIVHTFPSAFSVELARRSQRH
jgi:hypothetical protein